MKRCTRCDLDKPLESFGKYHRGGLISWCRDCTLAYQKEYYSANRKKSIEKRRQHYYANHEYNLLKQKERRVLHPEKIKEWRQKNKDVLKRKARIYLVKKQYGLSESQFNLLIDKQKNRCLICLKSFDEVKICVDHCHNVGHVRGILCGDCNLAEGLIRSPENARRLASYMESNEIFYPSPLRCTAPYPR
jgi:hypothetical protein